MMFEDILSDIKAGKFQPVYFLQGEEPYFIDVLADALDKHLLSEGEKGFNQTVLYGKDADWMQLQDILRRYPMMAPRQTVFLKEAQEMKGLSELMAYIDNPVQTTVLVVCHPHKKVDGTTKFGKALKAKTVLFESKKLYDNQVPDWIAKYCKGKGLGIEAPAAQLLADSLGTDLSKISNEIDKISLNIPAKSTINAGHIQEFVGISKDYNIFELQKALGSKDLPKLARIQQYFVQNIKKNPLIVTISSLYGFFSKVYMLHFLKGKSDQEMVKALELRSEWFLKDYKMAAQHYSFGQTCQIISTLKQYDLRSKGVDTDTTSTGEEELLRELLFKIVNG